MVDLASDVLHMLDRFVINNVSGGEWDLVVVIQLDDQAIRSGGGVGGGNGGGGVTATFAAATTTTTTVDLPTERFLLEDTAMDLVQG